MNVPRDPLGTLFAGLSLLNDRANVTCTFAPSASDTNRWTVRVGEPATARSANGESLLEAATGAYRSSVAELEEAVQRQVNDALERT